jgi:hypothetical protein
MSGTWLLPTKGRLKNLRRFINAAREHGTSTDGLILVNKSEWDEKQSQYEELLNLMPKGWSYLPVRAHTYGEAVRAVWDRTKDMDWVGLVSDDLVPSTTGWDKHLIKELKGWNFISSNDGKQAPQRMHGAVVWSGELMRAVGWIFPDGLDHIFHDDTFESLGRETGCWQVRMDVMVRHVHEFYETGVRGPTMDNTSELWKHDQARYEEWTRDEKADTIERIRKCQAKYDIRTLKPDFSNVNIMISTPSHSGSYESSFLISLYNTFDLLKQHNVGCQFAEEKYTAEISLARSKLFGAFLRSTATHMLMIDADMGWDVQAVVRMFCARVDLVAVAGPKKMYPLAFAANYTDEKGNAIVMHMDPNTGMMACGEVGMAFCLMSRGCAEKMAKAYPELEYVGVGGEREFDVFLPMVDKNKRRYGEDFSFCKRWRNIGGTMYLIPDVRLKHTGSHCFEGSLSEVQKPA